MSVPTKNMCKGVSCLLNEIHRREQTFADSTSEATKVEYISLQVLNIFELEMEFHYPYGSSRERALKGS